MSKKYDLYLEQHKDGVRKAFNWLKTNLPELVEGRDNIEWLTCVAHDASKTDQDEYEAYDNYFYGNRSFAVVEEFNKAWLAHIHKNPHHWQHWLLQHDDEGLEILDMPYVFIIEMICDHWSFSWKSGNLYEIFNWYAQKEDKILLSDNTRKTLNNILDEMKNKLAEFEEKNNE